MPIEQLASLAPAIVLADADGCVVAICGSCFSAN